MKWLRNLFRRKRQPLEMRGIVGVTPDGCYLVQGPDGQVVKSPPLDIERFMAYHGVDLAGPSSLPLH